MNKKFDVKINSETGKLTGVIIHTPGNEVENMTPRNAERALYSDILNLSVAKKEYQFFQKVLEKSTKTFQVSGLLTDILSNSRVRSDLLGKICRQEIEDEAILEDLKSMQPENLSKILIEGVVVSKDNLTKYLNRERYSLKPLHNFFFTRDSAAVVFDTVLANQMKNRIRRRESLIMEAVFDYHPVFNSPVISPDIRENIESSVSMEGGDIEVVDNKTILVGIGSRTSSQGVDFLVDHFRKRFPVLDIIVQELPLKPESFIHLDMVFTILGSEQCLVYEPVITKPNRYQTIHISVDNGKVKQIRNEKNIISALEKLGISFDPIPCGGNSDPWIQEREQWHSGANFFALDDGVVLGYARNVHTIDALLAKGFDILSAEEFLKEEIKYPLKKRTVITIEGSELPRGGGGCRCMTMPVGRESFN